MCWPRPSLHRQRHGLFVYCSGRSISILSGHIFSGPFTLDFFVRMPSYKRQRLPVQGKFMNQFTDSSEDVNSLRLKCKTVTVSFAEESLVQCKTIRRGIGAIKQSEGVHFVTVIIDILAHLSRIGLNGKINLCGTAHGHSRGESRSTC